MLSFSAEPARPSAGVGVSATHSWKSPSSFPTSAPAWRAFSPMLSALVSVFSSGDCRSGLGLLSAFPLAANLPRCCMQTKVPASDPGLYDPGSSVLEHSLHLSMRRESTMRWGMPFCPSQKAKHLEDPPRDKELVLTPAIKS